jgi:S1-C subfamily serine protease
MRNILCGLVLALCLVPRPAQAGEMSSGDVYKLSLPGVAWVWGAEIAKDTFETGTGFVIDVEKRLIVTCHHVVRDAKTFELIFPTRDSKGRVIAEKPFNQVLGIRYKAKVLAIDPARDLVLLQADTLPASVVALPLAAEEPEPGDDLDLIGCPGVSGALWGYSGGKVRQVYHREWKSGGDGFLQDLKARVVESYVMGNSGDSGAPVFNVRGEIVGMHQGRTTKVGNAPVSVMAYAISVEEIRKFVTANTPKPAPRPNRFDHLFDPDPNPFRLPRNDPFVPPYPPLPGTLPGTLPRDPLLPLFPPQPGTIPGMNRPSPFLPRSPM